MAETERKAGADVHNFLLEESLLGALSEDGLFEWCTPVSKPKCGMQYKSSRGQSRGTSKTTE